MNHSNVLIISDDTEFTRSVVARWQAQRRLPEITVTTGDLWRAQSAANYNLVIVGPLQTVSPSSILRSLSAYPATAAIYVSHEASADSRLVAENPHALFLSREDGWIATLILIATEALRRS